MSGDGSIVVRAVSASSGVSVAAMVRETLSPGASNASTIAQWFSSNNNTLVNFSDRTTTGGSTTSVSSRWTSTTLPYWLKVVRSGNTFSSYTSPNGVNWTQLGSSPTITMATNVEVGLAVASGSSSTLATATFDNVSVTATGSGSPAISGLSPTSAA